MGTRNLTIVKLNNETKVAQYGQWDGYPEGQGINALRLLRKYNIDTLKEKVSKLRWLTDEEDVKIDSDKNWVKNYPYLHRDRGATILQCIYEGGYTVRRTNEFIPCKIKGLTNMEHFAKDKSFCEWVYLVDLDKQTFSVYMDYDKKPLVSYSLQSLPSDEAFIKDCEVEIQKIEEKMED